ncbi:MAG: glycerol-3-phosphate 1-O-acyltransferase PlsY [Planctomycetaceae bacterium]
MTSIVSITISCVAAFLVGGIPFGYLLGRLLLKDDIRNHGSGNIGATNVGRVIGWKWGGLVLLLDAVKGLLPTLLARNMADQLVTTEYRSLLPVAVGVAAIAGHMYPIYLKLRGGKGVATALGVVLVLAPKAVAVAFGVFLLTVAVTRTVAIASIAAALTFGGTQLFLNASDLFSAENLPMTIFAVGIPILIIWRHRSNLVKLWKGPGEASPPDPPHDTQN